MWWLRQRSAVPSAPMRVRTARLPTALTRGAREKTVGDKKGEAGRASGRMSRVTCMPARVRAMQTRTRGNRCARRIRLLTPWGQAEKRPTAKCDHHHLVRSF
jgi:hypothetical protein